MPQRPARNVNQGHDTIGMGIDIRPNDILANIQELEDGATYSQLIQFRKQWNNAMDQNPRWTLGNMKSFMYRSLRGKVLNQWKNADSSQFTREDIYSFLAGAIGVRFKAGFDLKQEFINFKQGERSVNEYAAGLHQRWEAQLDASEDPRTERNRMELANAFRTGLRSNIGFQLKLNRDFCRGNQLDGGGE